jgi:lipopolysaccharide transport system permease protein
VSLQPQSPAAQRRVVIEARAGFVPLELGELWSYRDLVAFLALRDLRSRYKQTLLGASWALLQPLGTMVIFSALFGLLLGRGALPGVPGVPYEISTFCALVPWQLFATSLVASGNSLVQNQALLTKVYFPRLAAPIAPILAALVDFALAFAVLLGMLAWQGILPGLAVLWLPLLALQAALAALAVSLWLAALNALYRDVRHALPFLVQLWMIATPVVYASERLLAGRPAWQQWLYGINPMVGVVEGFRFALLGTPPPGAPLLLASGLSVALLLVGGAFFFRRMEQRFADRV